jgi:hypothetical protein
MANTQNAGQLATMIKQLCQNDILDLGNDDAQNSFIFQYMNLIMKGLGRTAYLETFSDSLAVSGNGYYTFLKNGLSTADSLYEPQEVFLTSTETPILKRNSYVAATGWYRAAHDQPIHIKGVTAGNYTLRYLRKPATITLPSDIVDMSDAANMSIVAEVVALIKLSKNSYAGSEYLDRVFKSALGNAAQGAMSSKGTGTSGQPLGSADVAVNRGG